MKFYIRDEYCPLLRNRCYLEAEQGRVDLALERMKDAAEEFPKNAHFVYAEADIRARYRGQGVRAGELFAEAYHLSLGQNKRETAWFSAFNARLYASTEQAYRDWAQRALELAPAKDPDRSLIETEIASLDSGTPWLVLHLQWASESSRVLPEFPALCAAHLEMILVSQTLTPEEELGHRRDRALKLRAADAAAHNKRLSGAEEFPPDKRGALTDAVREMELVVKADNADAEGWNYLSAWYSFLGRQEDAIKAADKAISLRPFNYARPLVNEADALYKLGRYDEAIACVKQAIKVANDAHSQEEVKMAERQLHDYMHRPRLPGVEDLKESILAFFGRAELRAHEELRQVAEEGGPTLDMLVSTILAYHRSILGNPPIAYVPIVAQLLGDFTPETAWFVLIQLMAHDPVATDQCVRATTYLTAHSESVRRRDASRLLAHVILTRGASGWSRYYRDLVFVPSAMDVRLKPIESAVRDALGRICAHLPRLVATQEPLSADERKRAAKWVTALLFGPSPPALHSGGMSSIRGP